VVLTELVHDLDRVSDRDLRALAEKFQQVLRFFERRRRGLAAPKVSVCVRPVRDRAARHLTTADVPPSERGFRSIQATPTSSR
jgi:hypothetical protein